MTLLTGPQVDQLQKALLSAFPSYSKLEQMVRVELGQSLATIASAQTNLIEVTFNLIKWAEAHNKIGTLIAGAQHANPDNEMLGELRYDDLVIDNPTEEPLKAEEPMLTRVKRQALQQRLELLVEEYEAITGQLSRALSAADKVKLERQRDYTETEIANVEAELALL